MTGVRPVETLPPRGAYIAQLLVPARPTADRFVAREDRLRNRSNLLSTMAQTVWTPPVDPDTLPDEAFERLNTSREALRELIAHMQAREERAPAVGTLAPDFGAELLSPTGERTGTTVRLSEHRGRPVALVFGSYT